MHSLAASASVFVLWPNTRGRRSAGADFASLNLPHGSRRHACCLGTMGECGWLLEAARQHITFIPPAGPGSKRTSRRAPMALRSARLAAADYGNGRRRCPQAHPDPPADTWYNDYSREPPTPVMGGGERLRWSTTVRMRGRDFVDCQIDPAHAFWRQGNGRLNVRFSQVIAGQIVVKVTGCFGTWLLS